MILLLHDTFHLAQLLVLVVVEIRDGLPVRLPVLRRRPPILADLGSHRRKDGVRVLVQDSGMRPRSVVPRVCLVFFLPTLFQTEESKSPIKGVRRSERACL